MGLGDVGIVVLYLNFSVAVGTEDCHFNLPQSYKLICYEPALCVLREVIKAFILELFSGLALREGGAEPDVLFQVFVG